ncbi:hypothetical protein ACP275_05G110700 [Erythranthe tilingii]
MNSDESKDAVFVEIPELCKRYDGSRRRRRRQIHRRPLQLQRSAYDPTIVSLGPYHHGRPDLLAADEVKYRFLDRLTSGDSAKKTSLYSKVVEKIDEIRDCYADLNCVEKYDDRALALMILLDACFVVSLVDGLAGDESFFADWQLCRGLASLWFVIRDVMLLENQIPLQVIKMIINLQHGEELGEELLHKFSNWLMTGEFSTGGRSCISPLAAPVEEEEPLHLLEACRKLLIVEQNYTPTKLSGIKFTQIDDEHNFNQTFRSVTELKEKGVEFKASSSYFVTDIHFESSPLSGRLHIPARVVSSISFVFLSNMIAYEMSPGSETGYEVLSYANFMKSLIESPADVKELQEKGILINKFQNHEQLLEEFKGVDTFGLDNLDVFKEVRREIEEHCRSKAKTWMADLIHTRFRSPWTVVALLAATFLLCLTFLQTFFTIHPAL